MQGSGGCREGHPPPLRILCPSLEIPKKIKFSFCSYFLQILIKIILTCKVGDLRAFKMQNFSGKTPRPPPPKKKNNNNNKQQQQQQTTICVQSAQTPIWHYLDDFLLVGSTSDECANSLYSRPKNNPGDFRHQI